MARQKGSGKRVVEDCHFLNAHEIYKKASAIPFIFDGVLIFRSTRTDQELASIGYLLVEEQGKKLLALSYVKYTETKSLEISDHIEFTTTKPHFGGERKWFLCPCCKERCGKLYLPPGSSLFRCHQCHSLTYTSCQESRRWDHLYKKLGNRTGMSFSEVKASLSNS